MKGSLIITVDYEVFGNGSGCTEACVVNPMERIAALVEERGGRLVVFVEALEFAAMEEAGLAGIDRVTAQLNSLVSRGHEIQLHLHPQWIGAKRVPTGEWVLDKSKWRVGQMRYDEATAVIERGRAWLRRAVPRISSGHHCTVFRAGGWTIQPGQDVLNALKNAGFRAESSVAPGVFCSRPQAWFNFRRAPALPWWRIRDDVTSVADNGLFEIPIATSRISPWRQLRCLIARKTGNELAPGCSGSYEGRRGLGAYIGTLSDRIGNVRTAMLDFCALPSSLLSEITDDWLMRFSNEERNIPVVAIGHTKNFSTSAEAEFSGFLDVSVREKNLEIVTYGEWLSAIA